MDALYDEDRTRFDQLWGLLVRPSVLEAEPTFRTSLREVMYSGLWWGGVVMLLAVAAHVGISMTVWGGPIRWTYSASASGELVLFHDVVVSAIGIGLVALSTMECSLSTGRFMEALAVLIVCGASMHDDLLQGPSIAVEFVTMIYLGAVVAVPFRPWQALGMGGGVLGIYLTFVGPGWFVPGPVAEGMSVWEASPFLAMIGVGGTGISAVLYATRWTQHRVRRVAERELRAAKQEAEAALETVEKQADQLRELDEMKSRFFANISHELRTPLSLMLGPVQQLLDEEGRPQEEQEILEIVHRNAERLQRLVEQLLDLARYDAGRLSRDATRREWAGFVEQVTRRFLPMAETQDVHLSVVTEDAQVPVVFDPDHMETVIANLVRNALSYTPGGERVTVTATVEAGTATLRVEDTGDGIPEETRNALFDRFYRGVGQTQQGGMGIGLALTQALVTLHEGTIDVESTSGAGSRFTVEWPAALPAEEGRPGDAGPADADAVPPPSTGGDGKADPVEVDLPPAPDDEDASAPVDRTTILVVEDNADVRRYVRRLLTPRYRVIEATNGTDGLERTRAALPDLVVADVMMPEMNGFNMVRALRQSRRTDCIPVVMLTARAEEADEIEGLEGGAEAYVTKPFDAEVLVAQINRLIAARRRLRDRFVEENAPHGSPEEEPTAPDSFEERARAVVRAHLADPDFSVEQLADEMAVSRRTVTSRLKDEVGQTPSQFLRALRLEKGAELLDEEAGTISEVAYAVGFNSLSYFSRSFKEHFGVSPSTYRTGGE